MNESNPSVLAKIDRLGRVRLDPQGYTGTACKAATAPAERAFRGASTTDKERPELHQTSIEQTQENDQQITGL